MILYKFRPVNCHTYDILTNNQLFFPKKVNLNDPFEFSVIYHARFSRIIGPIYFRKNAHLLQVPVQPAAATRMLRRRHAFSRKALYKQGTLQKLEGALQAQVDSAGILCLSAVCHSVLLWSHYAQEHQGVCLIFDTSKDEGIFATPRWKVHYSDRFPHQNILALNSKRKFITLLTTKSSVWKYEREYRYLYEKGGQSYAFNPAALVGIIFGCRTTGNDKNNIRTILSTRSEPVAYYEAVMDTRKYALNIVRA